MTRPPHSLTVGNMRIAALSAGHTMVVTLLRCLAHVGLADTPTVKLAIGMLKGAQQGDLHIYRGVPFATPPIGERRW